MLPARSGAAFDLMVELHVGGLRHRAGLSQLPGLLVAALQESPGLEIPMSYPYYGMVVGGVYLLLVAVRRIGATLIAAAPERAAP